MPNEDHDFKILFDKLNELKLAEDLSSSPESMYYLPLKPCDVPCPKCGSLDIHRSYKTPNSFESFYIPSYQTKEDEDNDFFKISNSTITFKKECIYNHCRCCAYEWAIDTRNNI